MGIVVKTDAELDKMWTANQVVCTVLDALEAMVAPGVTTGQLEARARELTREHDVRPAFFGYGSPPFPAVTCISVNDVIVHGIPSDDVVLQEGDVVSIDYGCEKDGYFGDSARTVAVGAIAPEVQRLLDATSTALEHAIAQCVVGKRLRDVSQAVQSHVESQGFTVVRAFAGHGIGSAMHEEPSVPNYVTRGRNPKLKRGMVLAIEPMVNVGAAEVRVDDDHWTARTTDGSLSAHFEHSVAIVGDTPWVLSRRGSCRAAA